MSCAPTPYAYRWSKEVRRWIVAGECIPTFRLENALGKHNSQPSLLEILLRHVLLVSNKIKMGQTVSNNEEEEEKTYVASTWIRYMLPLSSSPWLEWLNVDVHIKHGHLRVMGDLSCASTGSLTEGKFRSEVNKWLKTFIPSKRGSKAPSSFLSVCCFFSSNGCLVHSYSQARDFYGSKAAPGKHNC